jgi:hypothetical protein
MQLITVTSLTILAATTIAAPAGPHNSQTEDHEQEDLEKRASIGDDLGTTLLGNTGLSVAQSSAPLSVAGSSGVPVTTALTSRASNELVLSLPSSAISVPSVATSATLVSSAGVPDVSSAVITGISCCNHWYFLL